MKSLVNWWRALEDLVFPPSYPCPLCGQDHNSNLDLCTPCLDSLVIGWEGGRLGEYQYYSLFPYQGFAREMIHKMKFQSNYGIGQVFANLLALACSEESSYTKVDLVIPVPLHLSRLHARGFNQATVLADRIGRMNKWPVHECLVRTRSTIPQSNLSVADRQKNTRGAFAMLPGLSLERKLCLIVDDLITSGSTFQAMAQVVENHGGIPLGVFLARTEILKE